nr:hypothetical protein [Tanacetum cinerariifolium]
MVATTEPKTIQKTVHIAGTLTDEALRNGTIKKNPEKRGNIGEPSKDRNGKKDNKRTRTGNAFTMTANPVIEDCRVVPRNVNPINARSPVARTCFECDINPSDLDFSYEIEIASGQLVEIDKVIKGCKLEIEGHVFDINLIPFGSRSFDVIIGIDCLSDHKAEIICHEKFLRHVINSDGIYVDPSKIEAARIRKPLELYLRKDWVKPKRVRAMNMTFQSTIKDWILAAQMEASDESARLQKGSDEMVELRNDKALYYLDRIWVPLKGDVRP